MARNWRDVRSRMNLDEDKIAQIKERMVAEQRGARLRELREGRGMTQQQVADRMQVTQPRVAAIENGELPRTEVGTVQRYIEALDGRADFVAVFDGERLALS